MKNFFKSFFFSFLLSIGCEEKEKPEIIYPEIAVIEEYALFEEKIEDFFEPDFISKNCPLLPYEIGLSYTCDALCGKLDGCMIEKKKNCLPYCERLRRATKVEPFNKTGYCVVFGECKSNLWKYCLNKTYVQMEDTIEKERKDLCKEMKKLFEVCSKDIKSEDFEEKCKFEALFLKNDAWNYVSQCSILKNCEKFTPCIDIMDCFI